MSTYKVIQDIEAEDHILGPLSLRQFIFALISILCLYFCYLMITKHVAFLCAIFLPPAIFFGFFAVPFGRDQPTEIWALAKIRFLFKPRRRIWDQSGVKELVTVTAPKKVEEQRTNGLSQNEVASRLQALANTIDSRGWAVKNVNVNMYAQPNQMLAPQDSDRLVNLSTPQEVPDFDVQAADDILDERNNPIAQQFDQLINTSEQNHRQRLQDMMNSQLAVDTGPTAPTDTQPKPDYWFMNQPAAPPQAAAGQAVFSPQVLAPGSQIPAAAAEATPEEEAIAARAKLEHQKPSAELGNLKTILPLDQQRPQPAPAPSPTPPKPKAANLGQDKFAASDKNIDVLAREAKRASQDEDGMVTVNLH